jgi:hypothetical protein
MHGILRAATNGGERRENDFYPTPPEPTHAVIPYLAGFPSRIWEPACGDGGIAKPLEQHGYDVIGTDLVDRDYGDGARDFLRETKRLADAIITNPPFGDLAERFIAHALDLDTPYIAMLLNINFWSASRTRTPLWERRAPEAIVALTWKPDFTGAGRPYFNCVWTLWGPRPASETRFYRAAKPEVARPEWAS